MIPFEIEDTIIASVRGAVITGTILGHETDTGIDDNTWLDVMIWECRVTDPGLPYIAGNIVSVDPKNIIMNQTLKIRELFEL